MEIGTLKFFYIFVNMKLIRLYLKIGLDNYSNMVFSVLHCLKQRSCYRDIKKSMVI